MSTKEVSQTSKRTSTAMSNFKNIVSGLVCGVLFGTIVHYVQSLQGLCFTIVIGGIAGVVIGIFWSSVFGLRSRFLLDEWRVSEIQIDTFGQKWKLTNTSSQRRVAWAIFIELSTRIATTPIRDSDGDDGIALKSLYDLFVATRIRIVEMEPTCIMPSQRKSTDTVETYALAMLNTDLRPFLSRWHTEWDAWREANPKGMSLEWDQHSVFRNELRALQDRLRVRSEAFAKIAGVPEVERFTIQ